MCSTKHRLPYVACKIEESRGAPFKGSRDSFRRCQITVQGGHDRKFQVLRFKPHVEIDPSQQLRLTASRLKEFQVSIPMFNLPGLFKEAIRITQYVGIKYLWIDSLCIIQDSISDWEVEAPKMATVYSNAVASIAFLFPPEQGFVKPREDPRKTTPCVIRRGTTRKTAIYLDSIAEDIQ